MLNTIFPNNANPFSHQSCISFPLTPGSFHNILLKLVRFAHNWNSGIMCSKPCWRARWPALRRPALARYAHYGLPSCQSSSGPGVGHRADLLTATGFYSQYSIMSAEVTPDGLKTLHFVCNIPSFRCVRHGLIGTRPERFRCLLQNLTCIET